MKTSIDALPNDAEFLIKKASWIFNSMAVWLAVHLIWILPDGAEILGRRTFALSGNADFAKFASQQYFGLQLSSIFQNHWITFAGLYFLLISAFLYFKNTKFLWTLVVPMTLLLNARTPEILDGGNNLNQLLIIYLLFAVPFFFLKSKTSYWMIKLALLMGQIQVCFMYITAGWAKVMGGDWQSGLALFYIFQNRDFSFPFAQNLMLKNFWLSVVGSYFAVVFQAIFPILIWFKNIRPYLIVAGMALHLGIGIGMGLPNFSSMMCLSYMFFLGESDLKALENLVNTKRKVTIAIDENCKLCKRFAKVILAVDLQKKMLIDSAQSPKSSAIQSIDFGSRLRAMVSSVEDPLDGSLKLHMGFQSLLLLCKELILLFPLYPVLKLLEHVGVGDRIYQIVAKNRKKMGCGEVCKL